MTDGAPRVLPMISTPPVQESRTASTRLASERVAAGWEFRFVAEGKRAEEMIELYRELGFEVAADPVGGEVVGEGRDDCVACQELAADRFTAIYTRVVRPPGSVGETQ